MSGPDRGGPASDVNEPTDKTVRRDRVDARFRLADDATTSRSIGTPEARRGSSTPLSRPDVAPSRPGGPGQRRAGILARNPAWPITALRVGYPVWWALGLADFTWVLLAVPMVAA